MKKRVKKKHEHRYWLRNAKEHRVTWREFLESFTRELTSEEIAECIAQGKYPFVDAMIDDAPTVIESEKE